MSNLKDLTNIIKEQLGIKSDSVASTLQQAIAELDIEKGYFTNININWLFVILCLL